MGQGTYRRRFNAMALAVVATTTAALAVGEPARATPRPVTAAGASVGASTEVAPTMIRTIGRGRALRFPTGQKTGTPTGLQTPEIGPEPDTAERAAKSAVARAAVVDPAGVPVVKSSAVTSPVGLNRSFKGLDAFDQRYANNGNQFSLEPPDQGLCASAGFEVETVNDVVRVYRPSGSAGTAVTDLNTFLGYPAAINRTTGAYGPFVTDPSCIFDAGTHRFFVVALTFDVDPATGAFLGSNHLDVAVTATADPRGAWNIFRLPVQNDGTQGTPHHKDCPCIGDYPHIGADRNGIYLTTNEYPFSDAGGVFGNNYNGAQIYLLDKAALASGARTVRVAGFANTRVPHAGGVVPGFTVWPASVPGTAYADANGGTEYFLSSIAALNDNGRADAIAVWRIRNSSSIRTTHPTPMLGRSLIPSERYVVPPLSTQKAGPTPLADCLSVQCIPGLGPSPAAEGTLDSNDSRMQQVYYSGGHLYAALDTAVEVGGRLQAGIAWFVVDPGAYPAAATVAKQGYLGVAGNNLTYPAIAVTSSGRGAMAFTLSGQDFYPSAAYATVAGELVQPEVRVASAGLGPQDGFSEYGFGDAGVIRARWGDYGAAAVVGDHVWLASEYIGQRCNFAQYQQDPTCGSTRGVLINWGTRISEVTP